MKFFVTGSAGFIGFSLSRRLLELGHDVIGFDGMTSYYDVKLKQARHAVLKQSVRFHEHIGMLEDAAALDAAAEGSPDVIVHLAAQAGVRYSLERPRAYVDSNLIGTFNVLELARNLKPRHLVLASTSSIYGSNANMPFVETQRTDHPLTLYAATKKATEEMAHAYAHLWALPTTAVRFFSVYGPWGRPDMALFKFVKATLAGEEIEVFGHGRMWRDFTYIDDLVESLVRLSDVIPVKGQPIGEIDSLAPEAPYRVVNIGGGKSVDLRVLIESIENAIDMPVNRRFAPLQKGDVAATSASPALLHALIAYAPSTPVSEGVERFVDWYRSYYES